MEHVACPFREKKERKLIILKTILLKLGLFIIKYQQIHTLYELNIHMFRRNMIQSNDFRGWVMES